MGRRPLVLLPARGVGVAGTRVLGHRGSSEPRDFSWALQRRNLTGAVHQRLKCRVQRGGRDGNVVRLGCQMLWGFPLSLELGEHAPWRGSGWRVASELEGPQRPLLRAIFFPGVTELLGGPSERRHLLCRHPSS